VATPATATAKVGAGPVSVQQAELGDDAGCVHETRIRRSEFPERAPGPADPAVRTAGSGGGSDMRKSAIALLVAATNVVAHGESAPVVAHVHAELVATGQVRVTYDLADADGDPVTVTARASDDAGMTFALPLFSCRGDIHDSVAPGIAREFIWDAGRDIPEPRGESWQVEVVARDGTVLDLLPGGVPVEFVVLAPGSFRMGSSTGFSDEAPVHDVSITRPFYLGIYEITQAQWEAVAGAGPWVGEDLAIPGPHSPAAYLSWDDLHQFLSLANGDTQVDPGSGTDVVRPTDGDSASVLTMSLPGDATMDFVWIEPGAFSMGSSVVESGHARDEAPLREVTISQGFYLGRHEITQAQWASVMPQQPWAGRASVRESPDCPAVYLEWQDVQEFVRRLNAAAEDSLYRLPTEAEWEYACRAGTQTRWSFGDDDVQLQDHAWFRDNTWDAGIFHAMTVGTRLANPWGLFDMHGNVWEWVSDWYGPYPEEGETDPVGPGAAAFHVLRGGGFADYWATTRSASRLVGSPHPRGYVMGSRLLLRLPCQPPPATGECRDKRLGSETSYRLATEAEWEYACRAGTTTPWSFGADASRLVEYAWYRPNCADRGEHYGHQVGTRLPNPWGLYDMHGNLWEWVQDFYGVYPVGSQVDPTGPTTGAFNSRRGGGFANPDSKDLTASRRGGSAPYNCGWCLGARLAKDYDGRASHRASGSVAMGTREGRGRSNLFSMGMAIPTGVSEAGVRGGDGTPAMALHHGVPNPFNSSTEIAFQLPETRHARLTVHDLLGQPVCVLEDAVLAVGRHTVQWHGRDAEGRPVSSGAYLARLESAGQATAVKLVLIR